MRAAVLELLAFGLKEARACVFAGGFFAILVLSRVIHVPGLPRYDLILLLTLALQAVLLRLKVETWDEVRTLSLFHVFGLLLELFKTHPSIHSWSYPEPGYSKLLGVPLYSGFMYAAVASYMIQAWRIMDLELEGMPPPRWSLALALAIYLNFFTHHFTWDLRWPLTALVVALFWKARVWFTPYRARRWMPLTLGFALIGFFVWVAENMATFGGAWAYPDQRLGWRPVSIGKVHSWMLLVILSFVIVADLKFYKARRTRAAGAAA
jgi:uncharacterized membrane protein YoaT (DUF817 family)